MAKPGGKTTFNLPPVPFRPNWQMTALHLSDFVKRERYRRCCYQADPPRAWEEDGAAEDRGVDRGGLTASLLLSGGDGAGRGGTQRTGRRMCPQQIKANAPHLLRDQWERLTWPSHPLPNQPLYHPETHRPGQQLPSPGSQAAAVAFGTPRRVVNLRK